MNILLLLIPLSVLFVVIGGIAFFWAANRRQFDNLDAAALLPILDGDVDPPADRQRQDGAAADAAQVTGRGGNVGDHESGDGPARAAGPPVQ